MNQILNSIENKKNVFVPTDEFWRRTKEKKLYLQYCIDSGKFQHYPRPVSIFTGRTKLEWKEVSGDGVIYAVTVYRVPVRKSFHKPPFVIATIELKEKVRIISNIVNCSPEDVKIGMPVKLHWMALDDGYHVPAFELDLD